MTEIRNTEGVSTPPDLAQIIAQLEGEGISIRDLDLPLVRTAVRRIFGDIDSIEFGLRPTTKDFSTSRRRGGGLIIHSVDQARVFAAVYNLPSDNYFITANFLASLTTNDGDLRLPIFFVPTLKLTDPGQLLYQKHGTLPELNTGIYTLTGIESDV